MPLLLSLKNRWTKITISDSLSEVRGISLPVGSRSQNAKHLTRTVKGTTPHNLDYHLPIETWLHVFSFIPELCEPPESNSSGFFPGEDEEFMCDPHYSGHSPVFHSLRSITLVCRSWFRIGTPLLWSHVQVNVVTGMDSMLTMSKMLGKRPEVASIVTRLTVKLPRPYNMGPKALPILISIVSKLPNLALLECPPTIVSGIPPPVSVRFAVIQDHASIVSYWPRNLSFGNFPWSDLHTLSFNCSRKYWYLEQASHTLNAPVVFNDLQNLQLSITHQQAANWVSSFWSTPTLKCLSVGPDPFPQYLDFLIKHQLTLEKVKIPWTLRRPSGGSSVVLKMPELQELHLTSPRDDEGKITGQVYRTLVAPKLWRVVFYIDYIKRGEQDNRASLISMIDVILSVQSAVKEIGIRTRTGTWDGQHLTLDQLLVNRTDIAGWCAKGLDVEIFPKNDKAQRFTNSSFSLSGL